MFKKMSKTKREVLEKIAKKEILGHRAEKKVFNCGYTFCPITPAKSHLYIPSIIETSSEFVQALEDIKTNYPRDHLDAEEGIIADFLDQEGIQDGYELPRIDPLEDRGIHITSNPGFAYNS